MPVLKRCFPMLQQFRDCCVLRAEPDSTRNVNAYPRVEIALLGEQRGRYIAGPEILVRKRELAQH